MKHGKCTHPDWILTNEKRYACDAAWRHTVKLSRLVRNILQVNNKLCIVGTLVMDSAGVFYNIFWFGMIVNKMRTWRVYFCVSHVLLNLRTQWCQLKLKETRIPLGYVSYWILFVKFNFSLSTKINRVFYCHLEYVNAKLKIDILKIATGIIRRWNHDEHGLRPFYISQFYVKFLALAGLQVFKLKNKLKTGIPTWHIWYWG